MPSSSVIIIGAAAFAGVATLLLQPVPPLTGVTDSLQARSLFLIQPALLTLLMLWVGASTAKTAGLGTPVLDAWIAGTPVSQASLVSPIVLVAAMSAAIIAGSSYAIAPLLIGHGNLPTPPLATRVLYGGVTEEVIARFGLMSLVVWLTMRFLPGQAPYYVGIIVAAMLFAVGHLPLMYALVASPPPNLIATVLIGNTIVGAGFGWLYWRHGLEAAMLAHALAHVLAWLLPASST